MNSGEWNRRAGGTLEGFAFLEVFKICVTRELDAEMERRVTELKALSGGRFIVKLAIGSIHTELLM